MLSLTWRFKKNDDLVVTEFKKNPGLEWTQIENLSSLSPCKTSVRVIISPTNIPKDFQTDNQHDHEVAPYTALTAQIVTISFNSAQ